MLAPHSSNNSLCCADARKSQATPAVNSRYYFMSLCHQSLFRNVCFPVVLAASGMPGLVVGCLILLTACGAGGDVGIWFSSSKVEARCPGTVCGRNFLSPVGAVGAVVRTWVAVARVSSGSSILFHGFISLFRCQCDAFPAVVAPWYVLK